MTANEIDVDTLFDPIFPNVPEYIFPDFLSQKWFSVLC